MPPGGELRHVRGANNFVVNAVDDIMSTLTSNWGVRDRDLYWRYTDIRALSDPDMVKNFEVIGEDLLKRIGWYFGPAISLLYGNVRTDIIIPGTDSADEIVINKGLVMPQRLAAGRSLSMSGHFVWLQDPLRGTDTDGIKKKAILRYDTIAIKRHYRGWEPDDEPLPKNYLPFDIGEGSQSGAAALSVRGLVYNFSRYTLVMQEQDGPQAARAWHGLPLANCTVCFPGQEIQIGGISNGGGISCHFAFEVWDVPHWSDHSELKGTVKEAADAIKADPRKFWALVVRDDQPATLLSKLYCFMNVPKVGVSSVFLSEYGKDEEISYEETDSVNWHKPTVSYQKGPDVQHVLDGINLGGEYSIERGAAPTAPFYIRNKN